MFPIRSTSNRKSKIPLEVWQKATPSIISEGLFTRTLRSRKDAGNRRAVAQNVATWNPGSSDLQGLALDTARRFLFVACADHVVSIDAGHDGKVIDSITDRSRLDNNDHPTDAKILHAAASQTATLTIADVGNDGKFHLRATVPTAKGARGVVAGNVDTAYLIDPAEGRILKLIRK